MKSCIRICLALVFVLFASQSFARGGDEILNGGGLAEKNVFWAFERVGKAIRICLFSQSCMLTEQEKQTLVLIWKALPGERQESLVFSSEAKAPGTFLLNGEVKIAKTGNKIGDLIYLNTDLLYTKDIRSNWRAISIPEAVAVLVHEIGHHVGVLDHTALDLMGVKVGRALENEIQYTPLLPHRKEVQLVVINPTDEQVYPEVFLYVFDHATNLTDMFKDEISCRFVTVPLPIPVPDLGVGKDKPKRVLLHNLYWDKFASEEVGGSFEIKGNLSLFCGKNFKFSEASKSYKFLLSFDVTQQKDVMGNESWQLDHDTILMSQNYEPWWMIIRWPF